MPETGDRLGEVVSVSYQGTIVLMTVVLDDGAVIGVSWDHRMFRTMLEAEGTSPVGRRVVLTGDDIPEIQFVGPKS